MANLDNLLQKNIRRNLSRDEKPYFGLSERLSELEEKITESSSKSDFGIEAIRIINSTITGAHTASIDGLKGRLARLKELEKYITSSGIGKEETSILIDALKLARGALEKHLAHKSNIFIRTKNLISRNAVDVSALLIGMSRGDPLVALGVKLVGDAIRAHREKKRQAEEEKKHGIRADAETLSGVGTKPKGETLPVVPSPVPAAPSLSGEALVPETSEGELKRAPLEASPESIKKMIHLLEDIYLFTEEISGDVKEIARIAIEQERRAETSRMEELEKQLEAERLKQAPIKEIEKKEKEEKEESLLEKLFGGKSLGTIMALSASALGLGALIGNKINDAINSVIDGAKGVIDKVDSWIAKKLALPEPAAQLDPNDPRIKSKEAKAIITAGKLTQQLAEEEKKKEGVDTSSGTLGFAKSIGKSLLHTATFGVYGESQEEQRAKAEKIDKEASKKLTQWTIQKKAKIREKRAKQAELERAPKVTPKAQAPIGIQQAPSALPSAPTPDVTEIQQVMINELRNQGITDPSIIANIMAQAQAESGFKLKSENLNYKPERLMQVFPKYFKNIEDARAVAAQGPEAIANRVYGGRMGNKADEGFKYRGRGLIQLTGKSNYEKYGKKLGIDLVNNPDLANDPKIAAQIAAVYYADTGKGKDLTNINIVSKLTGHAGGVQSNRERAQYAAMFKSQLTSGILPVGAPNIPQAEPMMLAQNNLGNLAGATSAAQAAGVPMGGGVTIVNNIVNNTVMGGGGGGAGPHEPAGTSTRKHSSAMA